MSEPSVFANPTATSFAAPKLNKWQVVRDMGIMLVVGAVVFFAGGVTGWLRCESSHENEYSIAIGEIGSENQEEAQRFEELTNICKNGVHARLSCHSSYRDAHAQRLSKVQQPPVQGPATTDNHNG